MEKSQPFRAVYWDSNKDCIKILDQRKLPFDESWLEIERLKELEEAIKTLAVRGAPLLGVAAAFGVYIAIKDFDGSYQELIAEIKEAIDRISATRPTAVNLFGSLRRIQEFLWFSKNFTVERIKKSILDTGNMILQEEEKRSYAIARNGTELLNPDSKVLTHCNTGSLATAGIGTALGICHEAYRRGIITEVFVDETRPLLQGARLTAWELERWGIPHRIIVDSAAAFVIAQQMVDAVIVGADRIVRNGDTANKIGTYSLAIAAYRHRIPFIVAAPTTTFDLSLVDGEKIDIEIRNEVEALSCGGKQLVHTGAKAYNPAFDITPAELITAIVTEKGVIMNPEAHKIADHISRSELTIDAALF